jgi:hypothetical protein
MKPIIAKSSSLLSGASPEERREIVRIMQKMFWVNKERIWYQTEKGSYYTRNSFDWDTEMLHHLCHQKTIGTCCFPHQGRALLIFADFDDHNGSLGETQLIDNVKNVLRWLTGNGLKAENILVEHSGGGFHLWIRLDKPESSFYAVQLCRATRREFQSAFDLEMFPMNEQTPGGFGHVARVPLGLHQKRAAKGEPNAISYLCNYGGNEIKKVTTATETLDVLRRWRTLDINTLRNSLSGVIDMSERKSQLVDTIPVASLPSVLRAIYSRENRECIKKILASRTVKGHRSRTAYCLALECIFRLRMTEADTMEAVLAWNSNCTSPEPLTRKQIETQVKNAANYKKGRFPICYNEVTKYGDRVIRPVCENYNLVSTCDFNKIKRRKPIPKQINDILSIPGGNWKKMLMYALRNYWQDHQDAAGQAVIKRIALAKSAGLRPDTITRKMGVHDNRSKLDLFADAGIIGFEGGQGNGNITYWFTSDWDSCALRFLLNERNPEVKEMVSGYRS